MDLTYSETKAQLDAISNRTLSNQNKLLEAFNLLTAAFNDLGNMPSEYVAFVQSVDTKAAENPSSDLWAYAVAEKDALVSDFVALRALVTTARDQLATIIG